MSLYGRDIISILDLSKHDIEKVFEVADLMREDPKRFKNLLEGYILTNAFFEPSTRTRLSFESAMLRLGGKVISFSSTEALSIAKGETFTDTIRMLDNYSDIIVVRHKFEGAAKLAAEVAKAPIINGGDGRNQHPTQTLIDLYTITRRFGNIEKLKIGLLGDLKYARTANSLLMGLTIFKPKKLFLISPPTLRARKEIKDLLVRTSVDFEELNDVREILHELDVLYVLRIQKERFSDPLEYEKVKGSYKITKNLLRDVKDDFIIMHPLPRVDEIDYGVDETKYAYYFEQAKNGVPIRMALLSLILVGEEEIYGV